MRIHGICLVKNEADILRYFARKSAAWCDRIYVFDNGSTDGTWELCQELARTSAQVVPFRQDDRRFDDGLRAEVFQHFREDASPGDWWCRLDADEIYIDDPREFLDRVPAAHHVVWSVHFQFHLTTADLPRLSLETDGAAPEMNDSNLPRYYVADASEARFFRHRARLQWPGGAWPRHLGLVTPERIRLKHFQYRSPAQIQLRLDTRRAAAARGWAHFGHSLEKRWEEKIADPETLTCDTGASGLKADPARLPNHLEPAWIRAAKGFLHRGKFWP